MAGEKIYIAIAGNIGAGKSTLVEFLTSTYGVAPFFEPNDDNPYLADFYQDMNAWSFHSQIFFLAHKFRIHQELLTNVARHANATRVIVHLGEEDESLTLKVEDNGRGIQEQEFESPRSLGFLGLRERVLAFGGSIEV